MTRDFCETDRFWYIFANERTKLDYMNLKVVNSLKKYNPSLLLQHYRTSGKKEQAINLLLSMRKPNRTIRIIKEIIYTYVYFKDHKGALDYIRHYELTNRCVRPLESLIKIELFNNKTSKSDAVFFDIAQTGLSAGYREDILKALIGFYKEKYGKLFLSHLKPKLQILDDIFTEAYLTALSYEESNFLYKVMPCKVKFLKRMVKANPYIKKRYYFEYAAVCGVEKEDIVRILSVCYKEWALRIAFDKGWIDKTIKPVLDEHFSGGPIFINKDSEWSHRDDKRGIMFLKNPHMDAKSG